MPVAQYPVPLQVVLVKADPVPVAHLVPVVHLVPVARGQVLALLELAVPPVPVAHPQLADAPLVVPVVEPQAVHVDHSARRLHVVAAM